MRISFQHANPPPAGHESTLIFVEVDDHKYTFLIDAGEETAETVAEETLQNVDAIFLTHAHLDHYVDLGTVLKTAGDVPVYTSKPTAAILPTVFSEADRYQSLGGAENVTAALDPIQGWRNVKPNIDVGCLPAGHTPGATSFLFRFNDLQTGDEIPTLLATGDFTRRPVAETPGIELPDIDHPDIVLMNAALSPDFSETATDLFDTLLQRAVSGSQVVVAAGALTGVHLAWLLGHLVDNFGHNVPLHVVGQTAKLYETLGYALPNVESTATFERTDGLLSNGMITIAGPESPTQGSSKRLYDVIEDQPNALFAQVFTSGSNPVSTTSCATTDIRWSNHPAEATVWEALDSWLPRHLIVKHTSVTDGRKLTENVEKMFHWTNRDTDKHVLYHHGDWKAPEFVGADQGSRILRKNYTSRNNNLLLDNPVGDLPEILRTRGEINLSAEGVGITRLTEEYDASGGDQPESPHGEETVAETSRGSTDAPSIEELAAEVEQQQALLETLDEHVQSLESALGELVDATSTDDEITPRFKTVNTRLDELNERIESLPKKVREKQIDERGVAGVVVQQGKLTMIRLTPDDGGNIAHLDHGDDVEVILATDDNRSTE